MMEQYQTFLTISEQKDKQKFSFFVRFPFPFYRKIKSHKNDKIRYICDLVYITILDILHENEKVESAI